MSVHPLDLAANLSAQKKAQRYAPITVAMCTARYWK